MPVKFITSIDVKVLQICYHVLWLAIEHHPYSGSFMLKWSTLFPLLFYKLKVYNALRVERSPTALEIERILAIKKYINRLHHQNR